MPSGMEYVPYTGPEPTDVCGIESMRSTNENALKWDSIALELTAADFLLAKNHFAKRFRRKQLRYVYDAHRGFESF